MPQATYMSWSDYLRSTLGGTAYDPSRQPSPAAGLDHDRQPGLDYTPLSPGVPHVSETIVRHLGHNDRLALRATCRHLLDVVDRVFVRTMTMCPVDAFSSTGRIPITSLKERPDLWASVRALDLSPLGSTPSSRVDAIMATLPPFSELPALTYVRTSAEKAQPHHELATVIRLLESTVSNPTDASTPWRIPARPLPRNCTRFVLHIRYYNTSDLVHAQLSPRFWQFPATLHTFVLHIRRRQRNPLPLRSPRFRQGRPDNGFEEWARLVGLARVLLASSVHRIILVGADQWKPAWVTHTWVHRPRGATLTTFEDGWRHVCEERLVALGQTKEEAKKIVDDRFEFPTEDEYRDQVGETVWHVETASTLAEMEGWEV